MEKSKAGEAVHVSLLAKSMTLPWMEKVIPCTAAFLGLWPICLLQQHLLKDMVCVVSASALSTCSCVLYCWDASTATLLKVLVICCCECTEVLQFCRHAVYLGRLLKLCPMSGLPHSHVSIYDVRLQNNCLD